MYEVTRGFSNGRLRCFMWT